MRSFTLVLRHLSVSSLLVLLFPIHAAVAGPLFPPAGVIQGTMKPLSEVEPRTAINAINTPGTSSCQFRIAQSGSYYLTSNLSVYSLIGISGIEIAASNVTLDLNGFTIQGTGITIDGIRSSGGANDHITIRNGTVAGFSQKGINLVNGGAGKGATLENLTVASNGSDGMLVSPAAVVSRCIATQNGGKGIWASSNAVITSCFALSNASDGIATGRGATIAHCATRGNGEHGLHTLEGGTIAECSASENSGVGISVNRGSTITACTAYANAAGGIRTDNCATISSCTAYSNTGFGISGLASCTIQNCASRDNDGDGIVVFTGCTVRNNICTNNGVANSNGAAVHAHFGGNHIEGNSCRFSARGIEISQTGNTIVRNICSGNDTNWSIVPGNAIAPIVVGGSNAAAISGNSFAGSLGTTDPNANLTK